MAVVHYLNFNRSLRKVAKIYNCCHTTLSRWIKRDHGDKPRIRKISSIKRIDELVSEIITDNPFNLFFVPLGVKKTENGQVRRARVDTAFAMLY